jgi:hypothetical protein
MIFTELFTERPEFVAFLVKQSGRKIKTVVKNGIVKNYYNFRNRRVITTTKPNGELISVGCGINLLNA